MNALPRSLLLSLYLGSLAQAAPEDSQGHRTSDASAKTKVATVPEDDDDEVSKGPAKRKEPRPPTVRSIAPESLVNFAFYPPPVQQLVREALALTELNLPYLFGGTSPKDGGMDCSGTIYHLLNKVGIKAVPRQSDEICAWVQGSTLLHRTPTAESLSHPEFAGLQPGDLLFWSGTYDTGPRKIPVSHVMLYLGKLKKGGHVAFGASDGRYFQGERMNGVSVFDLSVPSVEGKSHLYGYGLIPGVGRIVPKTPAPPPAVVAQAKPKPQESITEPGEAKAVPETILRAEPATQTRARPEGAAPDVPVKRKVATQTRARPEGAAPDAPVRKRLPARRPPPEPTPKEQLTQAARKVVNTLRDVFTR